jgi:hypothetical protein
MDREILKLEKKRLMIIDETLKMEREQFRIVQKSYIYYQILLMEKYV